MRSRRAIPILAAVVLTALRAAAATFVWPADRSNDWTRAGVPGGIPVYTQLVRAADYGAVPDDSLDDTDALQAALDALPGVDATVVLTSGVYNVGASLFIRAAGDRVIRGAGPATRILYSGDGAAMYASRWASEQPSSFQTATGGYTRGSTVLRVDNPSPYAAGTVIEIRCPTNQYIAQLVKLTSVTNATGALVLDRPVRPVFPQAPQVRPLVVVRGAGVEDLCIRRTNPAATGPTIYLKYADACWVRRVVGHTSAEAHVWLESCIDCEVRGSYFHDATAYTGSGSPGYGVGATLRTSDCRIEDNIFVHLRHSMAVQEGANGNVFSFNFSTNRAAEANPGLDPYADVEVHGNWVAFNLFEGNMLEEAQLPGYFWPAGPGNAMYRNLVRPVGIEVSSPDQSAVGNELTNNAAITLLAGSSRTLVHGNRTGASTVWSNAFGTTLAASYACTGRPAFFPAGSATTPWPCFGPDTAAGTARRNPAAVRWESGAMIEGFGGAPGADTDGDGLSDNEELYTTWTDAARADTDGDGAGDGAETRAGTDPFVASSILKVGCPEPAPGGRMILRWPSVSGRVYRITATTDLRTPFSALATNLPATPSQNVYTDAPPATRFYRVELGP